MPSNELNVDDIGQLKKLRGIEPLTSDQCTAQLMNKVLAQSVIFLNLLEKEKFLLDQYDYLMLNTEQKNDQERLGSLESSIEELTQELTNINRRETCTEPFWTESHKVTAVVRDSYDSFDNITVTSYWFHTDFSYDGKAPIARIELDAGHQFSYLKTWWDPELSRNRQYILGGVSNLMRVAGFMTLGIYESSVLIISALSSRCQFTSMNLQGERSTVNCMKSWSKEITLPENIEEMHTKFNTTYEGVHSAMMDCYYREPRVTIYTRICDMHGNPERIESLKSSIFLLKQQQQKIQDIIQQSSKLQIELADTRSKFRVYAGKIEQQRELMTLIVEVFSASQLSLPENIKRFVQCWQERENKTPASISFETISRYRERHLNSLKNNIFTLFGQYQFSLKVTERELVVKAAPIQGEDSELFKHAKLDFERLALSQGVSIKKNSHHHWSIKDEPSKISVIKKELESIAEVDGNSCKLS